MKFENSPLSKIYSYNKVELPFGDFFLCKDIVISEIHEGVHYDKYKIEALAEVLISHYGSECKISVISNRVNSYSIDLQEWSRTVNNAKQIIKVAVVSYTFATELSFKLEKHFSVQNIETFKTLEESISWVSEKKVII
ncbi:hypothetical protein [Pseudotamlana agarivorans]|uniref:hypothetical protein n=1 Tax=Pseudotamlana agarivorans TaxID=481183 RepID=UPI00083216FF|nr:hypothetical protein [Tamlana agarivorans]